MDEPERDATLVDVAVQDVMLAASGAAPPDPFRLSWDDYAVPRYAARAEFRRRRRGARWVLAGVRIEGVFHPAADGVEPIRGRLPDSGTARLGRPPDRDPRPGCGDRGAVALEVAGQTWPAESRGRAPFASGTADSD